jgi:hypothetical protein
VVGIYEDTPAIGSYRDQPIEVGAKDRGVPIFEPREDVFVRMAERILVSIGYDGNRRRDGIEERLNGGRFRTMVAHFEDIRMKIGSLRQKAPFHWLFHVASQQEGSDAVVDAEGQRVVVP